MASIQKPTRKDSIIQFRVNSQDKSTIQRAAELRGIEPSVYIRSLVLETAKNEIRNALDDTRITLTMEQWEQFMSVMNAPVRLNKNLKKAFADFKKKYG